MSKVTRTNILIPVERSFHENAHVQYESSNSYDQSQFQKKKGQMSRSKGSIPTEEIFIRNMESLISKIFCG